MTYQAKIAKYKVKKVEELNNLIKPSPIIGIVNIENIPAPQLQRMRAQLKDKLLISMTKKSLISLSLKSSESNKKGINELAKHLKGMPALIFTKENPFKIASILRKNRTAAPAKAGQAAPRDIIIPAGPTQFAPGPIISELSSIGLKTGVEGGKVSIRQDHVAAKEGEKISKKVAEVITKLGIQPMEIGLDLVAVYQDGIIYTRDVLSVDEQTYIDNLKIAAVESLNLAVFAGYPAKETIKMLVTKAYNDAKALALSKELISDLVAQKMVVDAERQAKALGQNIPQEILSDAPDEKNKNIEKEIDNEIEEIKKEKEQETFFEETKHKNASDKEIAKKLEEIKKSEKEKSAGKDAEKLYDDLKKKGSLRDK